MNSNLVLTMLYCFTFGSSVHCEDNQDDPCATHTILPRAEYRGGQCEYNVDKPVCDRNLPQRWYRSTTKNGDLRMQTNSASILDCGTKYPYWMNGTHPSQEDGEVNRTVCKTSFDSNCSTSIDIKVKNCGEYDVYELKPLSTCDEGYCFGGENKCPPFDPCDYFEYTELTFDKDQSSTCDANNRCGTLMALDWYRFTGRQDIHNFLNQSYSTCSSGKLLWIKEKHEAQENGIVNYTLCIQQKNETCTKEVNAYSKQCFGYTVYNLPDLFSSTCEKICRSTQSEEMKWHVCRIRPTSDNEPGESSSDGKKVNDMVLQVLVLCAVFLKMK